MKKCAFQGLGKCDEMAEFEAEEQLAIAMADMEMEEEEAQNDNDFAMSESSAEFFFSRRASMDELSEPGQGTSQEQKEKLNLSLPNELKLAEENREFAQKHIRIELNEERESGPTLTTGKETPKVRRKGRGEGGINSARGGEQQRNGIR